MAPHVDTSCQPPNKQLQRTVQTVSRRGARASFHYARPPRLIRLRAAAELRRQRDSALVTRVAGFAGSAGNASGGLRWCVTASYADAILKITGSSPGAPQNSMLNGNGCGAFDAAVPVTEV